MPPAFWRLPPRKFFAAPSQTRTRYLAPRQQHKRGQSVSNQEKSVAFKVANDPSIDTTSRTGKLIMGILALIAEFENDIGRERQMDGIKLALERD